MSKITAIFTSLLLFIFVLFLLPKTTLAATCNWSYNPTPSQIMGTSEVTIRSKDLNDGRYYLLLDFPFEIPYGWQSNRQIVEFRNGEAKGTLVNDSGNFEIINRKNTKELWTTGEYKLFLMDKTNHDNNYRFSPISYQEIRWHADCSTNFKIQPTPQQSACNITVLSKPIEPTTEVELKITGISASNNNGFTATGGYDITINGTNRDFKQLRKLYETKEGEIVKIGNFPTGTYTVNLTNRCGQLGSNCWFDERVLQCPTVQFTVAPRDSGGGGQVGTPKAGSPGELIPAPATIKGTGDFCDLEKGTVSTAIGCIRTDPVGLVQDFFRLAVGIGGGIALLLMISGAFQMITSAGNPEGVKHGKEQFTSAIEGLLFIIFSILLLRIIGVDILGFGQFLGI